MQEIVNAEKFLNSSVAHNQSMGMSGMNRAKLELLSIPTFSWNIQEWESLFDLAQWCTEMIAIPYHKNFIICNLVSGCQVLDMIKSIPMTDANYEVPLERLK